MWCTAAGVRAESGLREAPGRMAWTRHAPAHSAVVDLPTSALHFLAPRADRTSPCARDTTAPACRGHQALLVLAHPRCGHTCAQLAAGFGVGTTTAYWYITEVVATLAALAPTRTDAVRTASGKAFVILDGTLLSIDGIAADRPFSFGKHRKHGMNVQVIAAPAERLPWASPALPGSVQDIRAARTGAECLRQPAVLPDVRLQPRSALCHHLDAGGAPRLDRCRRARNVARIDHRAAEPQALEKQAASEAVPGPVADRITRRGRTPASAGRPPRARPDRRAGADLTMNPAWCYPAASRTGSVAVTSWPRRVPR